MSGAARHTPGPWEYIPSTQHHGPYVAGPFGDVADCYTMSNPMAASVRNGGTSYPVHHQGDSADANARLIAAAPEMLEAFKRILASDGMRPGHVEYLSRTDIMEIAKDAIAKAEGRP